MGVKGSPLIGGRLVVVRWFAAVRLAFLALVLVVHEPLVFPVMRGNALADAIGPDRFMTVFVLGTAYSLVLAALAIGRPRLLLRWRRLAAMDLVLLAALVLDTGGASSPLRLVVFALPFLVAFVARPLGTFLWSMAAVVSYYVLILMFYGVWVFQLGGVGGGLARSLYGAALSAALIRVDRAVREHARHVTRAATIMRVATRERRRLADALKDGPVGQLLVASREVEAALAGDRGRLRPALASLELAAEQLRDEIFDLYPHVLDHAGLEGAVSELARRAAARGGFGTSVHIDAAAAGVDDVTVAAVLRELLSRAATHSGATHVDIKVSSTGGPSVMVEVRDDGCGFVRPSADQAARAQQFGLESTGERLQALGGSLDVVRMPASGTRVIARIPIPQAV
jgi:signal transduction histidine kinase